jgi:hypothetical protein
MLTFVEHFVDVGQISLASLSERATFIKTDLVLAVIAEFQIVVWLVIWVCSWELLVEVLILSNNTDTRPELHSTFDLGCLGRNIWQLQILESLGAERHAIIDTLSREFVVIYHALLPVPDDWATRLSCRVKSLKRQ